MSTRAPFEYAVLRVVPRVERQEFVNVGVVLYCQQHDFLGARCQVDGPRLRAMFPAVDVEAVEAALSGIESVCRGEDAVAAARLPRGQRFRWLTAPRSTVVQPGPVHAGLTTDPHVELDRLLSELVG